MEIKSVKDIKTVVGEMHDSEFKEEDFYFDAARKTFYLKTHSPEITKKEFCVELYNVEKYKPINLDKIKKGKATGGVFDEIKIENNGLILTFLSQDLKIVLNLTKLDGKFEVKNS